MNNNVMVYNDLQTAPPIMLQPLIKICYLTMRGFTSKIALVILPQILLHIVC